MESGKDMAKILEEIEDITRPLLRVEAEIVENNAWQIN